MRADTPQESPARDERTLEGFHPIDGAVAVNMSPALGEELGFDPYVRGVMVLKVERGSAANYNRLRPGDFIVDINGCLLYTSPSPRDRTRSRMPSSA